MFEPVFELTPQIAKALMRIEAVRQAIRDLPLHPQMLASLRQSARLRSTHFSTQIEGNRLSQEQVDGVIKESEHFAGRERDEAEIVGYYAALEKVENLIATKANLEPKTIQVIHALVMSGGRKRTKGTPYRDGQNVIRDARTGNIVYLPPEARDVSTLMNELFDWLYSEKDLPAPIRGAVAHYQYATIHPYYDGNGRTGRLLTTWLLQREGYDLKGIYSLEEYYAEDLPSYYEALAVGPSHNYYMGRKEASITSWVAYFCEGMAQSFEKVHAQAARSEGLEDRSPLLRQLTPDQRKVLEHFLTYETIMAKDVEILLGLKGRTARDRCARWVKDGFLEIADPSKKARSYVLASRFRKLPS